ncbi:hypothetical protein pb186bvf_016010 [Paramecium bursaria]
MASQKNAFHFELFRDQKLKDNRTQKQQQDVFVEEENVPEEDIFEKLDKNETKELDWNGFYNMKLKELRQKYPQKIHNEYTQMISEQWKIYKRNQQKTIKNQSIVKREEVKELVIQEEPQLVDLNVKQAAQFIEKLRESTIKLIIQGKQSINIEGELIIQAIQRNQNTIYVNAPQVQQQPQAKKFIFNKKVKTNEEDEDFVIENKFRVFL